MAFRQATHTPVGDGRDDARATVTEINALLDRWCESPRVQRVKCSSVIPDGTNREHTGVSLEHAHGIALSIRTKGFDLNHETPVVVRTNGEELKRSSAWRRWVRFCAENASATPPVVNLGGRMPIHQNEKTMYTTLGSSHLLLALRLVETDTPSVFGQSTSLRQSIDSDVKLRIAIQTGLQSVVLRPETPEFDRKKVSLLLNRAALEGWSLRADVGMAVLDSVDRERMGGAEDALNENNSRMPLFTALSRTLDAEELSSLVRIKHGIDLDRSQAGYADVQRSGGGKQEEERDAPRAGVKLRSRL